MGAVTCLITVCFANCGSEFSAKTDPNHMAGEGGQQEPGSGSDAHAGMSGIGAAMGQGPGAIAGSGGVAGSGCVWRGGAGEAGAAGAAGAAGEGSAGEGGAAPVPQCPEAPSSRIILGFDPENAERVTNLQWVDGHGQTTNNLAASGGPINCGDPQEFFGQSYGAPQSTGPNPGPSLIVPGSRSTSVTCGADITINSKPQSCQNEPQLPVSTQYHFYGAAKASQVRIKRVLGFGSSTPKYEGIGVRAWQPRVFAATFSNVIFPNAAETAVTTTPVESCQFDCLTAVGDTWSGHWFADISASGLALIVLRDRTMTTAVNLTVNKDEYSGSNLASFIVLQPEGGWKAPVTEIEYLCIADLDSWPQASRDAAKLPAFCGP
jgi:hypothetical protein